VTKEIKQTRISESIPHHEKPQVLIYVNLTKFNEI
jgi:hypothetical protein